MYRGFVTLRRRREHMEPGVPGEDGEMPPPTVTVRYDPLCEFSVNIPKVRTSWKLQQHQSTFSPLTHLSLGTAFERPKLTFILTQIDSLVSTAETKIHRVLTLVFCLLSCFSIPKQEYVSEGDYDNAQFMRSGTAPFHIHSFSKQDRTENNVCCPQISNNIDK